MRVSRIASAAAFAGFAAAAYSPFPLPDGFPSPSASQLKTIETLAGGSLPNGALPKSLTDLATVTLQLIATNEIFEVAYFTQLLGNITNNVAGYTSFPSGVSRDFAIEAFTAIKNQEELHAIGANAILANAGKPTVAPCSYNIPVTSYANAVALADTFTSVVLGVLPEAQVTFASDGGDEIPFVQLVGSIIAQEAQQDGWFRSQQGKTPSAAPFLTTEGPSFAFTFLSSVIAPGCASVEALAKVIPTYKSLTVLTPAPAAKDINVRYQVDGVINESDFSIVYLSGQNLPRSAKIYDVQTAYGKSTFKAQFPFTSGGFAKGLTVAAVVNTPYKAYASAADVASATVYGPGIIELD